MTDKHYRIEYFDMQKIRRSKKYRGARRRFTLSLGETTIIALEEMVEFGKGKYGSAVIELATRVLLALVSEDPEAVDRVFTELVDGIKSPYFARNFTRLYRLYMQ